MNYSIVLTEQARIHIRYLLRQGVMNRGEQVRLINALATRLQYQPTMAQGSVKILHQPNILAVSYELRVQPWRVFYNVDDNVREVRIEAVGYKVREKLLVEGKEVEL
ncbi:hypothetical protein TFLX_05513 [Thermoflexales bacterium]|nr:hypothetical protein TFLX_05513 [Thermoflexales bacterium]